MKCPKCGKPMTRSFCLYCGYMENGNTITKAEKNPSATDIEIYLGDRFDTICHNENMLEVHAILHRQRCYENMIEKTGILSDAYVYPHTMISYIHDLMFTIENGCKRMLF